MPKPTLILLTLAAGCGHDHATSLPDAPAGPDAASPMTADAAALDAPGPLTGLIGTTVTATGTCVESVIDTVSCQPGPQCPNGCGVASYGYTYTSTVDLAFTADHVTVTGCTLYLDEGMPDEYCDIQAATSVATTPFPSCARFDDAAALWVGPEGPLPPGLMIRGDFEVYVSTIAQSGLVAGVTVSFTPAPGTTAGCGPGQISGQTVTRVCNWTLPLP